MAGEPHIGLREYARRRAKAGLIGRTAPAVHKAVATGRLTRSVVRNAAGKFLGIIPEIADQEWTGSTDPAQQHGGGPGRQTATQAPLFEPEKPASRAPPADASKSGLTYARSRAVRESFLARMAEIEYRERTGALVEAEDVRREALRLGREVRDAILNIAGKIGPELAPISDPRALTDRLTKELTRAMVAISDGGPGKV